MRLRGVGVLVASMIGFLIVSLAPLYSQGTDLGTIRGTVTDVSGAVVPNANVEVTDTATNQARKLTTNAEGSYEAPNLRSGTYKVTVTMAGFNTAQIVDILVRAGGTVRADAMLQPQGTTETVVITAEAPLIASESATVSATLDNRMLLELPRDSRDIYSFLYLNPNITQADSDGAFKFIGSQSYGASFSLDGQRSNGGVFGQPTASQPSLETIGELVVLSNNFTAEYAGIANIRVITKRGGSSYHGSGFYNNKNSALAAWDLRAKIGQAAFLPTPAQNKYPYPYFNLNEVGGSFGGPLPKLKNTFFFAAYEHRWFHSPVNISSSSLPHPTLLAGDFSLLRDANKPAVPANVNLTAAEVAQNTVGGLGQRFTSIPSRLLNPTTTALIKKYFPPVNPGSPINTTNGRLVDYFNSLPGVTGRDLGTLRVDHDFSDHDRLYGVYNGQAQNSASAAVVSPFVGLGLTQNERSNHTLSLSETHLWGARVINEVRGGFNLQPTFRRSNTTLRDFLAGIGFNQSDIDAYGAVVTPSALDTYGHPAISFGTGFAIFANGGRNTYRPLDQNLITFGDSLTWLKGRHAFKFGADIVRNAALDGFTSGRGNPRGRINYTGAGPDAVARILMGLPPNTVQFVNKFRPPMDVHNWEQGFFAQDDFKVTSKLTLIVGLRYELITPFIEANDLLVNFDPNFVDAATGRKGRFVVPSSRTLDALDPRYARYGVVTADKVGVGRALVKTDRNNFAPRLGAAWRLTDRTVLRGGYGWFYPTSAAQGIRDPLATNSFQVGLTKRNDPANPLLGWPGATHGFSPLTGGTLNTLSSQISSNWVPFDLQSPRIEQYNFTFEREIGWQSAVRLSYLGTRMHGLISGVDANLIAPSDKPFGTTTGDGVTPCTPGDDCDLSAADRARLPYPELSDYQTSFGNFGHGHSNAFQTEFNRRFTGGFTLNASYTLLDQKSTAPDTGNASLGGTAYNQFSPDSDFGTDAFISHHRFIAYGVWQLPVGHGKKYASRMPKLLEMIAGGWETSWQMFAKSGTGFTPYWWCENCGPVLPGNVASTSIDAVGGFSSPGPAFRPVVKGEGNVKQGDRIFNPDAFALMPLGGSLFSDPNVAKRNLLRGPGTWGVNLGVHKVFLVGEKLRADLGADFNNLFNHPLKSPNNFDIGELGSFSLAVDPKTLQPVVDTVTRNPNFGRLLTSYSQESVDSRRTVRLKLRLYF